MKLHFSLGVKLEKSRLKQGFLLIFIQQKMILLSVTTMNNTRKICF